MNSRLLSRGFGAVAGRARQRASAYLEAARPLPAPEVAKLAAPVLERLRRGDVAFFAGALSEETPRLLAERAPGARERILESARRLLDGRFDLLGYRGLEIASPEGEALRIDWHVDPVSGRRAPFRHWSRIDPLDPAEVGDSKVLWELGRHQWLVRLAQAFVLTGDERYARVALESLESWLDENPSGIGIHWTSSLEIALRLISWCWVLVLLRRSASLEAARMGRILVSVEEQGRRVERQLSTWYSPNTHLTGEALGLFHAGIVFRELPSAARWADLGRRILLAELGRQVLPDGVHVERATCYQRYTADFFLHFLALAARAGDKLTPDVAVTTRRLCDFLVAIRRPDGALPSIGDADGGWLMPLAPRAADDVRGTLSTAAVLLGRKEYAAAAGGLAPEAIWLFGAQASAPEGVTEAVAAPSSRLFPDGGFVVMREGGAQLIFDVGPLGCDASAGHGHADLLSIQVSAFGKPFVVDPGTFCYQVDRGWRDAFRSTAFHATLTVDGVEQALPDGPFSWKGRRPAATLRGWISTGRIDIADASHGAWRRLTDPVVHRRRVAFVKPRFWVVVDDLKGADEHRVDLRFPFAPLALSLAADGWARARRPEGVELLLRSFGSVPLPGRVLEGSVDPRAGWISIEYGQREPAPMLVVSTRGQFPMRLVTLLIPARDAGMPAPDVAVEADPSGRPEVLSFGPERVHIAEDMIECAA